MSPSRMLMPSRGQALALLSASLAICTLGHLLRQRKLRRGLRRPTASKVRHPHPEGAILAHLAPYIGSDGAAALMEACRRPPALTTLRVQTSRVTVDEAVSALRKVLAERGDADAAKGVFVHGAAQEMICIPVRGPCALPAVADVVVVDRRAGEALLRGADVYAVGVKAASTTLKEGAPVAVIVEDAARPVAQGRKLPADALQMLSDGRFGPGALHVGNGVALLGRVALFGSDARQKPPCGLAVSMQCRLFESPALNGVLPEMLVLQNLPSGGRPHALPPSFRPAAHIPAELTVRVRVLARSPPRATELTRQALSRAAAIAAHALGVKRGWRVLDMCAAPGGKATHVAALLGGSGRVVACDRSVARLAALDALVLRLGLAGEVETRLLDGTRAGDVLPALSFDAVLLDPPCSALGVRPRLRTLPTIAELDAHAEYQRRLLRSAEALLKPGGVLVYSTCTTNPAENEANVAHALAAHPTLSLSPLPSPLAPSAAGGRLGAYLGGSGLAGCGLSEAQRAMVRRFDPTAPGGEAHIAFFIARFEKREAL